MNTNELPSNPHPRNICMMAAAILGQPEGTMDNRHPYWPQACEQAERAYRALAHLPAPQAVQADMMLVPVEIVNRFPEINPSNYDHDDACALNAWGVELVLAAAPSPDGKAEQAEAPFPLDPLEKAIDSFIEDYEMIGETEDGRDACHTPNDNERALIKDAIMGLLADSDWDRIWGEHIDSLARARATQPTASNAGEREAQLSELLRRARPYVDEAARRFYDGTGGRGNRENAQRLLGQIDSAALASNPPQVEQKPVGYMSAEQVQLIQDPGEFGGVYIPLRKAPAGLLTLALYTAPQPEQVAQDSERLDWMIFHRGKIVHSNDAEHCRVRWFDDYEEHETGPFNTAREAIDAARARGEKGGA